MLNSDDPAIVMGSSVLAKNVSKDGSQGKVEEAEDI